MNSKLNVLLIEDSPQDAEMILRELRRGGYEVTCRRVVKIDDVRRLMKEQSNWDVVLSDNRLNGNTVLDELAIYKECGCEVPFIVVSETSDEELAISAMSAGAHDYVLKDRLSRLVPCIQRELSASEGRLELKRIEKVQSALIRLSQEMVGSSSLDELLKMIHAVVSGLMPANNFYISLYDENSKLIWYPYYVDEFDEPPPAEPLGRGLTSYVLRTGKPLLASPEVFDALVASGEVETQGAPSIDWLGVPLHYGNRPIGVLVVQTYTEGVRYSLQDQEILEFVSTQIALAIQRKRTEEALEAESRFRTAIENSNMAGVIATDLEGRQSYVNPAFCRMVGWSEADLLGAKPPFVYWPPEEIEAIYEAFSVTTGEDALPSDFELRFQRKNGERFDVLVLVAPLTGEGGNLQGWLSSVYDITSRKQSEEDIRRQKARAEALVRTAERLNARLDFKKVLEMVCEETARALNVQVASIFLHNAEEDQIYVGAGYGWPDFYYQLHQPVNLNSLQSLMQHSADLFYVSNLQTITSQENLSLYNRLDVRTAAMVRMVQGDRLIGFLAGFTIGEQRDFRDEELALLKGLADQAIQAIVNSRLFAEIERRLDQLHALHSVDLAINASLDLRVTLNILLDHVIKLLNVDAADVLLFNPTTKDLEVTINRGFHNLTNKKAWMQRRNGYASQIVVDRNYLFIPRISETKAGTGFQDLLEDEGVVAYFGIPLVAKGQVKGVLEVLARSEIKPNTEWLEMVESLAGQAAIAIDNATLFDQLQRSNADLVAAYDSTLEGWTRALDLRDKETVGHTQRVVDLSLQLARKLGLREEELVHIRRGALLHDIGNIAVPDFILRKPGPLSADEWEIVRQHPHYSNQMISPIAYLRPAIHIPYCHHEKWDGSGYPRGLKAEQIPLAARLFSIVDVWDALMSDRPYRSAWTAEQARNYILEQSDKQFDPKIVPLFLDLV